MSQDWRVESCLEDLYNQFIDEGLSETEAKAKAEQILYELEVSWKEMTT